MKNFNGIMETPQKPEEKGLLSEKEALAYQDYATNKEGIEFSEEASEESYKEAEMLLKELQAKGIDLGEIDLEKIDLFDLVIQKDVSKRLENAVQQYMEQVDGDRKDMVMEKFDIIMKMPAGIRRVVAFATLLGLVVGFGVGIATDAHASKISKEEIRKESILQNFSPEIKKIVRYHINSPTVSGQVVFGYDSQGNIKDSRSVVEMINQVPQKDSRSKAETINQSSQYNWKNSLVENYEEVLNSAPALKGNKDIIKEATGRLKVVSNIMLINASIYKEMIKKGKIKEAQVFQDRTQKDIEEFENKIGGPIFNKNYIETQLFGVAEKGQ